VGELLDPGKAVFIGVEACLQHAQRERREGEHLARPADGLLLEALERHDGIDQSHLQRLAGVVLPAQEPDLLGLLGPHQPREDARAKAAIEGSHAGADLPEAGVLGGDRQVADDVQDVPAPDRVPRHHRDHRLWHPPDLDVEVGDVEATDGILAAGRGVSAGHVAAAGAAHTLVAARAEGLLALAGEDYDADVGVLASAREGIAELDHRLRAKSIADLGAVDRDLRDAGLLARRELEADVGVLASLLPDVLDGDPPWRAAETTVLGMEHWLLRTAATHPDRLALQTPAAKLTYRALEPAARRAAGALLQRGLRAGERVALALPPDEHFVIALHACLLADAVVVPVDTRLSGAERARRTQDVVMVLTEPLADASPADPRELRLDATATVMHTSGTTTTPRRVTLTYGNWLSSALGSAVALGLDPAERWLCPMPLAHVGGLSIPIRSAIYGTTAVLHSRFETDAVLRALMDPAERITLVSLVPTMLARLLEAGLHDPPALRWALVGGGPIAPVLLARAAAAAVPVAPTYGMTEACSQIATNSWPLHGTEVRIAADREVLVRGPQVARGALASDGWLHTGDIGAVDHLGRLAITGRKADTIITGGENVAPGEVEAVLLSHPAVADAGVFSRPDSEWGEALVAAVVLRDGKALDVAELRAHCAAQLAPFKVPKAVDVVQRLPRTPSGKLLRRELGRED